MEKKRINKLVVPLTIKSLSVLGAFTVMTSSLASCKSNKKTSSDNSSSIITSSSEDAVVDNNSEEIEINSSSNDESVTAGIDSKPNSNTNNNQSKSNTSKPSTGNKNNTTNNNQQPNQNNNTSNNKDNNNNHNEQNTYQDFVPLTPQNINDTNIFHKAVLEVAVNTRGDFGGIWHYYYNDQKYVVYDMPTDEFTYVLSFLNKDYLKEETLNKLIGKYSQEDLKRFTHILEALINYVDLAKVSNNWNGLIIDSNIANQLTNIEKAYLEYKYKNNPENLRNLLISNNISNPFVEYYLGYAGAILSQELSNPDKQINDLSNSLYFDKMEESENQALMMFNRSHGKAKVLE